MDGIVNSILFVSCEYMLSYEYMMVLAPDMMEYFECFRAIQGHAA